MIDVSFKFRCPLSWLRNGHVNLLLAGSRRHFFLKKIKMIKERDIDVYICGGLLNF